MLNKIILFGFLIVGIGLAQEHTLLGSNTSSMGWFGAPSAKITSFNEKTSVLVGARAGYYINHSLIIGGGVYALVTDVPPSDGYSDNSINYDDNLHLMYGGLELGYVINSMEVVHYSFNTLLGIGRVSYNNIDGYDASGSDHHAGESFFVIEPSATVQTNITQFLRFDVGISYRFATGLNYPYLSNNEISGLSGVISLNVGTF